MITFKVSTPRRECMVDISAQVRQSLRQSGVTEGLCVVYIPHTTAGVTINENADPDVCRDFTTFLSELVPQSSSFKHREGNSDSHIKASMMGFSATIPVNGGEPVLGTWQGIYLCEFDGPRTRKVHVKAIAG